MSSGTGKATSQKVGMALKERLYGKQKTTAWHGTGLRYSSGFFAGGFSPRNFIAICKSFHASFFCRGSRSRYAGWYVTSNFESLKSYQRPRRLAMESFTASRFLA